MDRPHCACLSTVSSQQRIEMGIKALCTALAILRGGKAPKQMADLPSRPILRFHHKSDLVAARVEQQVPVSHCWSTQAAKSWARRP
jgi:hypothetical protein